MQAYSAKCICCHLTAVSCFLDYRVKKKLKLKNTWKWKRTSGQLRMSREKISICNEFILSNQHKAGLMCA